VSKGKHTLGDAPVQPELMQIMNSLAHGIDEILNGQKRPKQTGFVLMVFPFEEVQGEGRCNYISNAQRDDIVVMLKEQIKRFEGQPDITGHA
jgi:TolB-like protein